jgi:hypothetical protein
MAKASRVTEIGTKQSPRVTKPMNRDLPGLPAAKRGRIVSWTEDGLFVAYGQETAPIRAESLVALTPDEVEVAVRDGMPVMLVFEDGDPLRPLLIGLVRTLPATRTGLPKTTHAKVDGQRIEFAAKDEVVLRCGEASITLRRNGRVVIKGAYVETRSRGTNRIKGGHVSIN